MVAADIRSELFENLHIDSWPRFDLIAGLALGNLAGKSAESRCKRPANLANLANLTNLEVLK